ncbi:hypothetical protein EVAR_75110_1 [Eumeta japonica]|uniref:Uncharacterized protein n=1 Tax=Eumeta variegata TaxID=151549 RepID=A0A4C1U0T0_EUMVA|nr:hypothetical protein EVAR_75110_1 [Eumeta japonica]
MCGTAHLSLEGHASQQARWLHSECRLGRISYPHLARGLRDKDMLDTGMDTARVGVAHSTLDTHRVRVHNRASVGATVARRAYRPAPYMCFRIDAARLLCAEIVLNNGDHASTSHTTRKR